jgi:hypothetical protein
MSRLSLIPARATRLIAAAIGSLAGWILTATPAWAHGEVTGAQDIIQDYGVFIFLLAVVLIGAGVLVWVLLSPTPDEELTGTSHGEIKEPQEPNTRTTP